MADEIGIAEQYAGRVFMSAKDGDGFSGLHHQRFVRGKFLERANDGMKTFPIPCRFSRAAVDHQVGGFFRDLWIEIIQQHAKSGFLLPTLAGDLRSAGRLEWAFVRRREYGGLGGSWSHRRNANTIAGRKHLHERELLREMHSFVYRSTTGSANCAA